MHTKPSNIFDQTRIRANNQKAMRANVSFLFDEAQHRLMERLAVVNREFRDIALDGDLHKSAQLYLARRFDGVKITSMMDEQSPIGDNAFDLAISINTLHKIDDVPAYLQAYRNILRPDGLFHCAFLGGNTLQELRFSLTNAELEICEGAQMRLHPTISLQSAGQLLQGAGMALCVADRDVVKVTYRDFWTILRELRDMGEGNGLTNPAAFLRRDVLARAEEIYRANFGHDGVLDVTFELIFMHGWVPHKSQQKPLQPGSADIGLTSIFDTPKS